MLLPQEDQYKGQRLSGLLSGSGCFLLRARNLLTMLWAPLIILLGTWCTGSSSQPVVTQPSSVSVSPGNTVKLSCTMSSGTSIADYYVSWYQQKPGNSPRYLLYYYSDSSKGQGSGVPARFSGSKDTASNAGYLTISGALAEDETDYYCAVIKSGSAVRIFGGGTQLTVLGQPKASPTMHLFPPSSEEIKTKSKATLVCLLGSFYPGSVQITWKADGQQISTGVETTKPSKQSDNKFMASSYLSLDASKWKTHDTYTCQVTHDGKNFEKSLKSSECS
ncbi:immunoglobulin lambda-1 light chain-like isoform X3 [Dermochelys coriacea]|uniref:immunoglobulin lambda-1 light chain-like isoform X3 n=1 Tax=Dermochelys coriacea TaxID=27794 RepID=UPI001CA8EF50|nr:immunoglobulin lambda-1 light chain-like isoform X3 [Dermochelys coriacea]